MQLIPQDISSNKTRLTISSGTEPGPDVYAIHKSILQKYIHTASTENRTIIAQTILQSILKSYWKARFKKEKGFPHPGYINQKHLRKIEEGAAASSRMIGKYAATLDGTEASYLIGNVYTALIPVEIRSANGVYYTPPGLTGRLLNLAEKAGVNWSTAKVLDPACGGYRVPTSFFNFVENYSNDFHSSILI